MRSGVWCEWHYGTVPGGCGLRVIMDGGGLEYEAELTRNAMTAREREREAVCRYSE